MLNKTEQAVHSQRLRNLFAGAQCSIFDLNVTVRLKLRENYKTLVWKRKVIFFLSRGPYSTLPKAYLYGNSIQFWHMFININGLLQLFFGGTAWYLWFIQNSQILSPKDPTFGLDPLSQLMHFWLLNPNLCLLFTRNPSFCLKTTFSLSEIERKIRKFHLIWKIYTYFSYIWLGILKEWVSTLFRWFMWPQSNPILLHKQAKWRFIVKVAACISKARMYPRSMFFLVYKITKCLNNSSFNTST